MEGHAEAAQRRLEQLRAILEQVSNLRTSAFQRRLQLLFAITAIAGVVGLYPAAYDLNTTWRVWTVVLLAVAGVLGRGPVHEPVGGGSPARARLAATPPRRPRPPVGAFR